MTPRPLTVVAGFLGAGKTTLVNRILSAAHGTRYAVLVNDFGSINVDAALIAAHDGQTLALTNGCICCAMSDGFIQTMLRLMDTPERFDHIIIEASGVAQPDRIMDFARLDPLLWPDAIVTLVDCSTLAARLADPRIDAIVADQIRRADLLALTRGTGADPAQLKTLNPHAPRLDAGTAPLDALIGTALHVPQPGGQALPNPFHHTTLTLDPAPTRAAFDAWMAALPETVLRGKGIVRLASGETVLWQRAGARDTVTPWPETDSPGAVVLIATAPVRVTPP